MMTIATRLLLTGAAVLLGGPGVAAEEATSPPPGPGCARLAAPGGERGLLSPGQQEAIAEALRDEYQGQTIYARVLRDLGEIRPFSRVVHAEQRHAAFLEDLLKARGLPIPEDPWAKGEVPTYASRGEACAAAVEFEVQNVALYDRLLADESLPTDVRQVFEHNRTASLDHHRPAFERCAGGEAGRPASSAVTDSGGRRRGRGRGQGARRGCGCGCGSGCGGGQAPGGGRRRRGGGPTASAPAGSGS